MNTKSFINVDKYIEPEHDFESRGVKRGQSDITTSKRKTAGIGKVVLIVAALAAATYMVSKKVDRKVEEYVKPKSDDEELR